MGRGSDELARRVGEVGTGGGARCGLRRAGKGFRPKPGLRTRRALRGELAFGSGLLEAGDAGGGDLAVLRGGHAGDADGADNFSADDEWEAALDGKNAWSF